MIIGNEDKKESLQDIINNSKLSEGYLTLARDLDVMEPKTPEDIYKVILFFGKFLLLMFCAIKYLYFTKSISTTGSSY